MRTLNLHLSNFFRQARHGSTPTSQLTLSGCQMKATQRQTLSRNPHGYPVFRVTLPTLNNKAALHWCSRPQLAKAYCLLSALLRAFHFLLSPLTWRASCLIKGLFPQRRYSDQSFSSDWAYLHLQASFFPWNSLSTGLRSFIIPILLQSYSIPAVRLVQEGQVLTFKPTDIRSDPQSFAEINSPPVLSGDFCPAKACFFRQTWAKLLFILVKFLLLPVQSLFIKHWLFRLWILNFSQLSIHLFLMKSLCGDILFLSKYWLIWKM